MQPRKQHWSTSLLFASLLIGSACVVGVDSGPSERHCVNNEGNQWCRNVHGTELFCVRGRPECNPVAPDGCEPQEPVDPACYSPCGLMQSLSDAPSLRCEGFEGPEGMTTSSTSSAGDATTTSTSSTSEPDSGSEASTLDGESSGESSTEPLGCIDASDCTLATPACNQEGVCVACDAVDDGDAACAAFDETAPLCREERCVACDDDEASACPAQTPACASLTCVACTLDDPGACEGDTPLCDDANTCVACTDDDLGACADLDAQPVCFEHTCVACTEDDRGACQGTTPICDVETHTCVPCTEHAQCESNVCRTDSGECISPLFVLIVDGSDPECGQQGGPFCNPADALAVIPEGQLMALLVHPNEASSPYVGLLGLEGNRMVMVLAADDQAPPVILGNGGPGLTVRGGARVWLEAIHIVGNTNGLGILVTGNGSRAELERCQVASNRAGGLSVTAGATAVLINSFFSGYNDADAVSVTGGTGTILYSTLAGQFIDNGTSRALACDDTSTVTARNSFFVAGHSEDEVECDVGVFSHSAAEMELPGTENATLGARAPEWFVDLTGGDLHLNQPPEGLLEAALWEPRDPTEDIDGDPRTLSDAERGIAGADVPTP